MHCFGCGVDLLDTSTQDRRALDSLVAADVVEMWKLLLFVSSVELNVELFRGEDSEKPLKMCKKCFTAYRTYGRHYQVIHSNMKKTLGRLKLVSTPESTHTMIMYHLSPKKPGLSVMSRSSLMPCTDSTTQSSPDVAVCHPLTIT